METWMSSARELPNIAAILGPLLQRVSSERRPLFLAIAERMAAERYRDWASATEHPTHRSGLLACADREEEIARRVEALDPGAAAIQADILAENPDLAELDRSIFADRPLGDQYAMQAQGERAGASTWRAFAEGANSRARQTFLECAELEEQSAAVLDSILAGQR